MTTFPTATTLPGQRRQVFEGKALKTRGGLEKEDLKKNKEGKIVSKKASAHGKKMYARNKLKKFMAPKFK